MHASKAIHKHGISIKKMDNYQAPMPTIEEAKKKLGFIENKTMMNQLTMK